MRRTSLGGLPDGGFFAKARNSLDSCGDRSGRRRTKYLLCRIAIFCIVRGCRIIWALSQKRSLYLGALRSLERTALLSTLALDRCCDSGGWYEQAAKSGVGTHTAASHRCSDCRRLRSGGKRSGPLDICRVSRGGAVGPASRGGGNLGSGADMRPRRTALVITPRIGIGHLLEERAQWQTTQSTF